MQLKLWAPLVVAAGLLAAGSAAMLLLPETALQPLEDTIADAAQDRRSGSAASSRSRSSHRGLSSLASRADALRTDVMLELQGRVARGLPQRASSSGGGGGQSAAAGA